MSSALRLWLLPLLIAGCAHPQLVVPDSDWQKVPAPQRAAIDRQHEADLVSARAELKSASAGLADVQRGPAASAVPAGRGPAAAKPDPDADPWAMAVYDHDQSRVAARARVHDALALWQRTRLTWRQRQLDAASARLDMVVSDRELTRARAIDHSLPGTDHYDSAPLQGQFSSSQKRWHAAAIAARQARAEFERASTTLASAKEGYAQLMRNGPVHLALSLPAETDERPRLELTVWTVTRTDIGRRRGLRRLLDAAANAPPQLRKREVRLRPMRRTPTTETPRASAPVAAPRPDTSAPAAEAAPGAKSSGSVEQARPAGATSSATPASRRAGPRSVKSWEDFVDPAARPAATPAVTAARVRSTTVAAPPTPKPWDFVEPAARPATAARSATAIRPTAASGRKPPATNASPAAKSWDFVEPAPRSASATSASAAAPARAIPAASAPPAAKSWDFVEPAPRPSAAARSAAATRPGAPSGRKLPAANASLAAKPWDFVDPPSRPTSATPRPGAAAALAGTGAATTERPAATVLPVQAADADKPAPVAPRRQATPASAAKVVDPPLSPTGTAHER